MNSIYYPQLLTFIGVFADIQAKQEEWKERIRKQWKESMRFPRKKKKAVRKHLKLEWEIACWNFRE